MTQRDHRMLNFLISGCILMIFVVIMVWKLITGNGSSVLQSILQGMILLQLMAEIMIITVLKGAFPKDNSNRAEKCDHTEINEYNVRE